MMGFSLSRHRHGEGLLSPKIGRQRSNRAGIMGIRLWQCCSAFASLRRGNRNLAIEDAAEVQSRWGFNPQVCVRVSGASLLPCLLATDNPVGIPRLSEAKGGHFAEGMPLACTLCLAPFVEGSVFRCQ